MTTPDGSSPPDALGTGQFAAWQAMTEADAKAQMRGPISGFSTAQTNFHGKFDGYATGTDLADLQDRTQMLEGVIGYAHAYCTGGAPVGNADTFIPLNIPVGPAVGVTRTTNRFLLGSRGLWIAQGQIGYDSISGVLNTYINAQIRIYTPGGTLFAQRIAETVTSAQHTCTVQMPFVVPAAGYWAELWGFMGLARGIKGGSNWTGLSVQKESTETS
ncbi:hypothetical protein [Rhodococcus jostii]|uniref:hypothetical protein n=1 Tax=Rhodococcus jostii TaxID=132919 RepID=UPI00364323F4